MSDNKWQTVGSLRKGKNGKLYIKVTEGIVLKKDAVLQLRDPRQNIKDGIAAGRLTEEKGAKLLETLPEFVKYDVILPPQD